MMKRLLFLVFIIANAIAGLAQLQYPQTKKTDTTDNYFGTKVPDPYRWLEDDNSVETKAWVQQENKVTFDYLATIPYREKIHQRLQDIYNYPRYSAPFRKGNHYFSSKNNGLQNQQVWYVQNGLNLQPEIFIDPNKFSEDGTVSLGGMSFSKNGRYMAFTLQKSGSDWQMGYVLDVQTKKRLPDSLEWLKFTGFSWKGDDGFYYTRYPEQNEADKLKGQNVSPKVYFHQLGLPQSEDKLVYEDKDHPQRFASVWLTEDERFLMLQTSEGTSGGAVWAKDLQDSSVKDFILLIPGFATEPSMVDNLGGKLLLQTNDGAPNYKIVLVDPRHPQKEHWKEIIPEQKEVLQKVGTAGGYLFASYLKDASTRVYQYTYEGKMVREIKLPGIGTASGFESEKKYHQFFYTFVSYNYPPSIFKFDINSGKSTLFRKAAVKFSPEAYEVQQVFFNSKDGTKIPMFITYKKGIQLDGQNPVLMEGYGGFNIATTPYFNPSVIFFLEQGGIFADVVLRGGNDYGEEWHQAGMQDKKQNVFDDFMGAAEFLIKNKYTRSSRLAIEGGSNGGLLIGACMTQRPELFKVALPHVGVMDMLRYHKFTIGYAWAVEYGSSNKVEQFDYLIKYSPLHNLKKGVSYPATMVFTADHDDRVVPAHSFKFAATLQECNAGNNPVLIRVEKKAGHGGGMPVGKRIDLATDMWSFTMYNLGMKFKESPGLQGIATKKPFR